MKQPEDPINFLNLAIMGGAFQQLIGLLLAPVIALTLTLTTLLIAWGYCADTDFSPLPRAGTIVTGIAFLYIVMEEAWNFSENLRAEIEAHFQWWNADADPKAAPALRRYREFANWSVRIHRPLVRVLEAALIVVGTLLSAVGDLVALRLIEATAFMSRLLHG